MDGKRAMDSPSPRRPSQLPDYSEACLQALVDRGLAQQVSLGGGLGLLHYLDYRQTLDVDAWWAEGASAEDRRLVTETLVSALQPHGQVKTRAWGDVVSIELLQAGRKVFSFQIAPRSAQLQPSSAAPWIAVPLDSFPDLVASKMVALVERGAPRDFRDIYAVCTAGLLTPDGCWSLWRQRQALAGSDTDLQRARLAITTHLARIVQHRRLDQVADPLAREQAAQIRTWFMDTFLGGNDDSNQLD
jgi:predicted nucleotidyltransferase